MTRAHAHLLVEPHRLILFRHPGRPLGAAWAGFTASAMALIILAVGGSLGCADTAAPLEASPDGRDAIGLTAGKADGSGFSSCELEEMVWWVNRPEATTERLRQAGIHTRAARNIAGHRAGADGRLGTADDRLFGDAREIDDVFFVGPVAMRQLARAVSGIRIATR